MQEELDEFGEATDIVGQADAMVDLIYFALGTLVEIGVDGGEVFDVVHEANIGKLGPDGRPVLRADGKIGKPQDWVDPTEKLRGRLVMRHSKYELVVADDLGCVAAALAMVAQAAGLDGYSKEAFARLLPPAIKLPEEPVSDYSAYGVIIEDGSLDRYLIAGQVPLQDDFLGIEFISEMTFVAEIQEALAAYDSLAVGFDASFIYPETPNLGHFAVVAEASGSSVLLVDPGPRTAGLLSVNADDLYAAIRAKRDGLHRFRVHHQPSPSSPALPQQEGRR